MITKTISFAILMGFVLLITKPKSMRGQYDGPDLDDEPIPSEGCLIPCEKDTDCRERPNCTEKWFCINLKCMFYDPEPLPIHEPKCAQIDDKCHYDYDCDWGNRDKMYCPWYLCNQTTNKCFFLG